MESGFTQHHSKGLFTFYREQVDHPKRGKGFLKSSVAVKERQEKKHYVSLSAYDATKQAENLQASKQQEPKKRVQTYRYHQMQQQSLKKPLSSPRHIFEPRLIEKSTRKNGYFLQLIGVRNKLNRSEMESYLKKQAKMKNEGRRLIGELSARQLPASEIKQLFLPKKEHYAKVHAIKKSPLKLNAITAHCIEQPRGNEGGIFCNGGSREVHVGGGGGGGGGKEEPRSARRNKISSMIFRDLYESRRNKLESGSFWQEAKLKRDIPPIKANQSVTYKDHSWSQFEDSCLAAAPHGSLTNLAP